MPRFRFNDHRFDTETRELVFPGGHIAELKPKNAAVLELLIMRKETVVTREVLFEQVWPDVVVSEQALNKVINELRTTLGDHPRNSTYIKTYTKKGYRWIFADTVAQPHPRGANGHASTEVIPQPGTGTQTETGPSLPGTAETKPTPSPGRLSSWRPWKITVVGLSLLFLGALVGSYLRQPDGKPESGKKYIALTPVLNHTGNEENGWVETGLRDLILQVVQEQGNLEIIEPKDLSKGMNLVGMRPEIAPTQTHLEQLRELFPMADLVWTEVRRRDQDYILAYRIFSPDRVVQREIRADSLIKCGNLLAYKLIVQDGGQRPKLRGRNRGSPEQLVNEIYAKGMEFLQRRELDKAINHFEVCLDNDPEMAWAQLQLARALRLKGELGPALDLFSAVYERSQMEKNPFLEAKSLRYLGLLARHRGEWEKALSYSERGLVIYQNLGNVQGEILSGNQIATIHARMGNLDKAANILNRNWQAVRTQGNKYLFATTTLKLATVLSMKGDIGESEPIYFEALAAVRQLNDHRNEASILENLGNIYYLRKNYDLTQDYYQQALKIYRKHPFPRGEASCLHNLGVLATASKAFDKAAKLFAEAQRVAVKVEDFYLENQILHSLGSNALHASRLEEAEQALRQSIEVALRQGNDGIYLDSACHLALIYVKLNRFNQAQKWLDQIENQAQELPAFFASKALLAYKRNRWELAYQLQLQARDLADKTWSSRDETRLQTFQTASLRKKPVPLAYPHHVPLF